MLRLQDDDIPALADSLVVQRFATGKTIQVAGTTPDYLSFVMTGSVILQTPASDRSDRFTLVARGRRPRRA